MQIEAILGVLKDNLPQNEFEDVVADVVEAQKQNEDPRLNQELEDLQE